MIEELCSIVQSNGNKIEKDKIVHPKLSDYASVFKFGKREHLEDFYNGKIYLNYILFFSDVENKELNRIQVDREEGRTRLHSIHNRDLIDRFYPDGPPPISSKERLSSSPL